MDARSQVDATRPATTLGRRPSIPRWLACLVSTTAAVAALASCSVERALPIPDCADGGSAILAAQSVPTAALVPCFDQLPDGWDVVSTTIGEDGTVIRLDSDRAGPGAAVFRYTAECDVRGAVEVPSEYDGARQYELVERILPAFRARRYHVVEGGCLWWEFDFREGAESALSIELGDRLQAVTRDALNDSIRESFLDEEV